MLVPVFQKGLQAYIIADEHPSGAGASATTAEDQSVFGRDASAASPAPTIKTNAVGGKKAFVFNGTANPLVFNGSFKLNCGFIVYKNNGNFSGYNGLLSSPADFAILEGLPGTNLFYDNTEYRYKGRDWFEYRLNNRIYSGQKQWIDGEMTDYHTPPAPVDEWGIIFFRFWRPLVVEGFQIGQDRNHSDRKLNGEVALVALYDRAFCAEDIDLQFKSLAYHYKIPIAQTFPFPGSKGDIRSPFKNVLSDNQPRAVTRVKVGRRNRFKASFGSPRSMREVERADAFINYVHPGKTFLFADWNILPPTHTPVELPAETAPEFAEDRNLSAYQLEFLESLRDVDYYVPSTEPAIDTEVVVAPDTEPPTNVTLTDMIALSDTAFQLKWNPATDNIAVVRYIIQYAKNIDFTVGQMTVISNGAGTVRTISPVATSTEYFARVKAVDAFGNSSVAWSNVLSATTLAPGGGDSDPVITKLTLPAGTVGVAYNQTITVTGGNAPLTWSKPMGGGALPAGLTLNAATGVLSGTPTTAASYTFTIRVTDTDGDFAERAYTVAFAADTDSTPEITTTSMPAGEVGTPYSATIAATFGNNPIQFSIVAGLGTLPPGLGLTAASGLVSGTPTTAGTYPFTVRATDVDGDFDEQALSILIVPSDAKTYLVLSDGKAVTSSGDAVIATY